MTENRGHWYNYKTGKYNKGTPVNFADYIPQLPSHQGLYDCYLARGESPLEAVIKVLRQAVGLMAPTPQPGVMIPSNHDGCAQRDGITLAIGLTQFGTYNSFPEPARKISVDEFTNYLSHQTIVGTETRRPQDLMFAPLRVFWMEPGYGLGVSQHQLSNERMCDEYMYRYWFFGCDRFLWDEHYEEHQDHPGDES